MSYVTSFHIKAFLPNSPSKIKSKICFLLYFKLIMFAFQHQFWWLTCHFLSEIKSKNSIPVVFNLVIQLLKVRNFVHFPVWFNLIPEKYGWSDRYEKEQIFQNYMIFQKKRSLCKKLTLSTIFRFCDLKYSFCLKIMLYLFFFHSL